ncbi:hypothetical protein PlfCFBP13513_12020 [Plantibacter flavus]|uniref:hypothetical protein n=1 Tax=Plantibacter TaxID=190323 RepID=UPI0010C1E2C5|nr:MULTISPECIES: hypothetical protein [Plantibacter]MBD8100813.1 hypothetical protein [Plantibacter sp. CFBP 8775]MBD8518408.1 hypothetical protein [Plantibacter sp. CFBP 8804]TKK00030.1 hypothetical protein PlfCFBP13513_12020 [Plantibacter flavus]
MDSLVQQRLAFERERTFGWVMITIGLLFVAGSVWFAAAGSPLSWAMAVFWTVWACFGIRRVATSRRTQQAFEREHGATAGVRR